MLVNVHRDHTDYQRQGAQEVHLDFHTAPEVWNLYFKFIVALRPQRPYGLFGTGGPGRPPRLSHSS